MREENAAEDLRLIQETLQGRTQSFKALVHQYQGYVFDLCLRMLGNPQEAEDVAQDTFLALYLNLAEYKVGHKLSNWIYTIALNRCRSLLRRRRILQFFSLNPSPDILEPGPPVDVPAQDPPLDHNLSLKETQAWVQKMVQGLPVRLREPFVLRHLHQKSYEEIAHVLGIRLSAVKVRLHRAKLFLWKAHRKDVTF